MMTILTARGQKMKVVIDGVFIVKNENSKILSKTNVTCIKKSLKHVEFRFKQKLYDFFEKKQKF